MLLNLLLLVPVLINLLLICVCDVGLWYVLSLIRSVFAEDYENEGKLLWKPDCSWNNLLDIVSSALAFVKKQAVFRKGFRQCSSFVVAGAFDVTVEGNSSNAKSYEEMLTLVGTDTDSQVDTSAKECIPYPVEPDWNNYYAMRKWII